MKIANYVQCCASFVQSQNDKVTFECIIIDVEKNCKIIKANKNELYEALLYIAVKLENYKNDSFCNFDSLVDFLLDNDFNVILLADKK